MERFAIDAVRADRAAPNVTTRGVGHGGSGWLKVHAQSLDVVGSRLRHRRRLLGGGRRRWRRLLGDRHGVFGVGGAPASVAPTRPVASAPDQLGHH